MFCRLKQNYAILSKSHVSKIDITTKVVLLAGYRF